MKIPKQINLKTALILLVISILLTSALFYAFAATPSSTFYISSGVYPGAPSYTIWGEGANYFAKDMNGMLKYSGTSASQIIQNCIDAAENGSRIFVKNCGSNYVLDTRLNVINKRIQLESDYAVLEAPANDYAIKFRAVGEYPSGVSGIQIWNDSMSMFDGFQIQGDNSTSKGIWIDDSFAVKISNCKINLVTVGINISSTEKWCEGTSIENVIIDWAHIGIDFKHIGGTGSFIQTRITDLGIQICHGSSGDNGIGIRTNGMMGWSHFSDVKFWMYGDYKDGLSLDGWCDCLILDNLWFDYFDNTPTEACGITLQAGMTGTPICLTAPAFSGNFSDAIYNPSEHELDVRGRTYQNRGTTEASNDDWIVHGLVASPTVILLTVMESDAKYFAQVKAVNATKFQLYLWDDDGSAAETVNKTICWYAEWRP